MQQENKAGAKTAAGVAAMFSLLPRAILMEGKTLGPRVLRHPMMAPLSLAVAVAWAFLARSPGMWAVVGLGVLGYARQAKARCHSYQIGGCRYGANAEVCGLFAAGLGLLYLDPPAGGYLLAAAAAAALTHFWVDKKTANEDQDMIDAQLDAQARMARVRDRRV